MTSRSIALFKLHRALSESLSDARDRVEKRSLEHKSSSLILYGAGNLGLHALKGLRSAGVEPIAFADDTPEKQGTVLSGLAIVSPADITTKFGSDVVVVVTMMTSRLSFLQARDRLNQLGVTRVVSFPQIAWTYAGEFLPYYQFQLPETLLAYKEQMMAGAEIWYDDESIRQYTQHLIFRLTLDFELLPPNDHGGYYPAPSIATLPPSTTFVDCGAYDGDTVREFLQHHSTDFREIHAFEPDPVNYQKLQDYTSELSPEISSRIKTYCAGTGNKRGNAAFEAAGNMSSSLTSQGTTQVDIVRLDDINIQSGAALFLKLDVEGFEQQTLEGASQLIAEQSPLIAFSVYHRPNDLWELPQQLHALNSNYQFFLRTHGEDGMDVICYAVPQHLLTR